MDDLRAFKNKTWSEKKSLLYVILILIFVCLLAAVIIIWKLKSFDDDVCTTIECLSSSYFLLDLIDTNVNPCDDFYNFTCGNYKGHLLVYNFQNEINRRIRGFVTNPVQPDDSKSVKLQKKYYQACMNISGIQEDQNRTLKKLFEQLGGWPVLRGKNWKESDFNWGKIVEKCKQIGFYYDWFINIKKYDETIFENNLYVTFPDNVNQIENVLKNKYVILMTNVAVILGAPGTVSNISESMNRVMEFEIGLSKIISETKVNATSQEYTVEEIKYKYPNIPWSSLLKYVILPKNRKIYFNLDKYIPKLEEYLNKTDKRVQADYIFWKLTESFSAMLTHIIRKEFEIYANLSIHYQFARDRENYCYSISSTVFAYVSEGEFVRKLEMEKEYVNKMVDRITTVLRRHIDNAKWMSNEVKNVAFNRIKNMTVVIGGPEEMFDEDHFDKILGIDEINLDNLNNTIEIVCEVDRQRDLFNLDFRKPKLTIKQTQFYRGVANIGFTKYIPEENTMFLPAAALGSIFYSPNNAHYLNFGAIGTIISHELAHGFGLLGNLAFDYGIEAKQLNYTLEQFVKAAKCLLEDCNNIGVENSIQMLCKKTFEENFADYVGINLSYEAYRALQEEEGQERNLPGLHYNSNQLFWIIYSSIMCNNVDVKNTKDFIHMLPYQRILGAYRNTEYFAKDFNCPIGSNMNPEEKCQIL